MTSQYSPQLSKSRFMAGLQCLKRLYLECYDRDLADQIDARQQAIFGTGTGVGELARERYPNGRLIEEEYFQLSQAARSTEKALSDTSVPAIFEGAFAFEKIRVRVDILNRNEEGSFDLIEVKSTTRAKSEHIPDVAIQLHVLEGVGISVRQAHLMHINNEYVYQGGAYDLEREVFDEITSRDGRLVAVAPGPEYRSVFACSIWNQDHESGGERSSWVEQTPPASILASGIGVLLISTWLGRISRFG